MEIGIKIKQLRKLSGMTQEQLAEKLNVSRQTISKWETGGIVPDVSSVVKICTMFHVSLDDLLLEEDGGTTEVNATITLEDLVKINRHNRKMMLLLMGGLLFLMVSILTASHILALYSTTNSVEYMIYRYVVTGEYTHAPVNYMRLLVPVAGLGGVGAVLCLVYMVKNKKEQK